MIWLFWAVLLVIAVWLIWTYNGLVALRHQIENAWKQIDVQLKRRYDLIPNLVETVRGYMKHEQDTLKKSSMRAAEPWLRPELKKMLKHKLR